jgi:acyl dehydratase
MKFQSFKVGQVYRTQPYTVTLREIREFAQNYDPHYYHLDETRAQRGMFGGIVASGMHSMSIINGQWVRLGLLGEDMLGGLSIDARWMKAVLPGDTICADVEITNKRDIDDRTGIVSLQFTGYNQHEEVWAIVKIRIIVAKQVEVLGELAVSV